MASKTRKQETAIRQVLESVLLAPVPVELRMLWTPEQLALFKERVGRVAKIIVLLHQRSQS